MYLWFAPFHANSSVSTLSTVHCAHKLVLFSKVLSRFRNGIILAFRLFAPAPTPPPPPHTHTHTSDVLKTGGG